MVFWIHVNGFTCILNYLSTYFGNNNNNFGRTLNIFEWVYPFQAPSNHRLCVFVDVRSTFRLMRQPKSSSGKCFVDEDGDLVVHRNPLAKGVIIGKS